ncbi:porin family protein [Flavicella marina]|uniref:porin family protein n=1 Tax=Flavicella marina TaxID=1475951 RepID=UPI001264EC08|nr:porin family protein [Flavicella marina]
MFQKYYSYLFFFLCFIGSAQKDSISIDPRYLEDQLYLGLTYNIYDNTPEGFLKDGFAYGISTGFIRDIPFNKRRNFGVGLGLGYSFNTYIQNVVVTESNQDVFATETFDQTYTIKTNSIDIPFQIRWRTSTLQDYKFWRIYTGVNFSYILNSSAIGTTDNQIVNLTNVLHVKPWQYSFAISAGYGTWNVYFDYALVPFFEGDNDLRMNTMRLGLMFYIF